MCKWNLSVPWCLPHRSSGPKCLFRYPICTGCQHALQFYKCHHAYWVFFFVWWVSVRSSVVEQDLKFQPQCMDLGILISEMIHHFGLAWNISRTILLIVMKFYTDINPFRMNPNDFDNPLTLRLVPSGGFSYFVKSINI